MRTENVPPAGPAASLSIHGGRIPTQVRLTPSNMMILIGVALTASLVHELGHWFWATLVDGVPTRLTLLSARPIDPTVTGSVMATAAGPLASLIACYTGVVLLRLRPQWAVVAAGIVFLHAFVRLGPYAAGATFASGLMSATDEGIVSMRLGLPLWSFALLLTSLFLVALVLAWHWVGGTLRQRLTLVGALLVIGAAGAAGAIALEPVLFG
jgi:hypothetical protein